MDLNVIKNNLSTADTRLGAEAIDGLYHNFVEQTGDQDLQAFVHYLHQVKQINARELVTILSEAGVEVTGVSELAAHTAQAESATSHDFLAKVGEGGMGEILLAKDPHLRRRVAYKKLHPQFAQNKTVLGQFFTEVQITSQLEHPHVVPIYHLEVDQHQSIAYSMKLVQGKSFKELITEAQNFYSTGSPMPESHSLARFLEHFLKVCNAMEYAHQKGVIHRDLKPANIMIGAYNEVYVLDWGIAGLIGKIESAQIMGTPRYMSPEQAGGLNSSLDQQSDLFSLGLILFEVVTLTQAIPKAKDVASVLSSIIKGQRNDIVHFSPTVKVPPELAAIIAKATQRRRKDRYASVKELTLDIRRYLRGEAVEAHPDTALQKLKRWISQNREKTSALILGLFLTLFCITGLSLYLQNRSTLALQTYQQKLHAALVKVTEKTQQLNEQLIDIDIILARLGTMTAQALDYGPASKQAIYSLENYRLKSAQPPDMVFSENYQQLISPTENVFVFANQNQPSQLEPLIQSLSPLKTRLRQTLLESAGPQAEQLSQTQLNHLIIQQELPFSSVTVSLDEGLTVAYPGRAYPGYEPRQSPGYKQVRQTQQADWQPAYRSDKGGSQIPYLRPIYDRNQQFRGVAAVEISSAYMQKHFLELDLKGVLETSIVNKNGEIIFDAKNLNPSANSSARTPGQRRKLDNPALIKAIQAQSDNYYSEAGILYIYYYLSAQDWFYLVKADEQRFLAGF